MILDGLFEFIEIIRNWFRRKETKELPFYELVENDLGEGMVMQGVKILRAPYTGVIVSIHPNVKFKKDGDEYKLQFDFTVEYIPTGKDFSKADLFSTVGDVIVDLMDKDYNA